MAPSKYVYYYHYFFDPGTQLPGNEKNYAMQYKKYKSQAKIFIILLIIFFNSGTQFPGN